MVKLVKITTVYGKMLTKCENLGKGQPRGMFCQKKRTRWMCTMDEKRWSLYKWVGRKKNNPYRMCKVRMVFNVKCVKQHWDVWTNIEMSKTTLRCLKQRQHVLCLSCHIYVIPYLLSHHGQRMDINMTSLSFILTNFQWSNSFILPSKILLMVDGKFSLIFVEFNNFSYSFYFIF